MELTVILSYKASLKLTWAISPRKQNKNNKEKKAKNNQTKQPIKRYKSRRGNSMQAYGRTKQKDQVETLEHSDHLKQSKGISLNINGEEENQ